MILMKYPMSKDSIAVATTAKAKKNSLNILLERL